MNPVYIYGIVNLKTGRVDYVGQTCNLRQRASAQIGRFKRTGLEVGIVLLRETTSDKANEAEEEFFDKFKAAGCCALNGPVFWPAWMRPPFDGACGSFWPKNMRARRPTANNTLARRTGETCHNEPTGRQAAG